MRKHLSTCVVSPRSLYDDWQIPKGPVKMNSMKETRRMFIPLDELESARWSQIKREKNIWMYVYKIVPTLLNCLKQQPNLFQQND